MKWSTSEIAESVLLDCFYKSLGAERKKLVDKLVLGGLLHPPYAIASQLIDTMSMTNNEAEKEHTLASLLTQLVLVTKNIIELEVPDKRKDLYIPLIV